MGDIVPNSGEGTQEDTSSLGEESIDQDLIGEPSRKDDRKLESFRVGDTSFTWGEIGETLDCLNITLATPAKGKVVMKMNEVSRGSARKRGGDRELHNLRFNVNYEKDTIKKGLGGVK